MTNGERLMTSDEADREEEAGPVCPELKLAADHLSLEAHELRLIFSTIRRTAIQNLNRE